MAVINISGKNYLIDVGVELKVSRLKVEEGEKIVTKDLINGSDVTLEVMGHEKGDKISVIKFRNKTRYKRKVGYRDLLTKIKMVDNSAKEVKEKKEVKKVTKPVKSKVKTQEK